VLAIAPSDSVRGHISVCAIVESHRPSSGKFCFGAARFAMLYRVNARMTQASAFDSRSSCISKAYDRERTQPHVPGFAIERVAKQPRPRAIARDLQKKRSAIRVKATALRSVNS
jgi:hypothetical protein